MLDPRLFYELLRDFVPGRILRIESKRLAAVQRCYQRQSGSYWPIRFYPRYNSVSTALPLTLARVRSLIKRLRRLANASPTGVELDNL